MTELETSQPTEVQNEIPKGFLSVGEIAAKHPDWARQIENSAKASLEGASAAGVKQSEAKQNTPRVMVYLNDPIPLMARMWSTDKPEEVPNKQETSMLAMDVLFLIGDPVMRLDLEEPPEDSKVNPQYHEQCRGQVLDYCFRRNSRKQHFPAQKLAYYKDKTVTNLNEDHDLWDKLPDFRVLIGGQMAEAAAPKKKLNDRVRDAMQRCDVALIGKQFTKEQVQAVKADLMNDAHLYGYGDQLQGKHSDEHIRLYMKDAIEEYGPKTD